MPYRISTDNLKNYKYKFLPVISLRLNKICFTNFKLNTSTISMDEKKIFKTS